MARLVVLPLSKSFEIAYKSIKARFFRSLVTTLTLVLAVSFLAFSQININIADSLLATGDPDMCQTLIHCGYDINPGDTSLHYFLFDIHMLDAGPHPRPPACLCGGNYQCPVNVSYRAFS